MGAAPNKVPFLGFELLPIGTMSSAVRLLPVELQGHRAGNIGLHVLGVVQVFLAPYLYQDLS